jgi:aminomethyltransferase
MLKRTPLHAAHQRLGARLVEFGGWEMPVHYAGIMDEHLAVRRAAGLFDISHMGEVRVEGPGALGFLNRTLTNDLGRLSPGHGQYTLLCNSQGGTIDDLYAFRLAPAVFLLVINASRIEADVAWLKASLAADPDSSSVKLEDISSATGALALQGPASASFIDRTLPGPAAEGGVIPCPSGLKRNQIAAFPFGGATVWVARTGYTGEDGFEIVAPAALIEGLWTLLLEDGRGAGIAPCGLGARDTLRTEMCYPLYGHELDEQTSPIEAGLGAFVALDKAEFHGRSALAAQRAAGPARRCAAFRMLERSAPPRPGYSIWSTGPEAVQIGVVSSGTQGPSLGIGIGMGYLPTPLARPGALIDIEIRGKRAPAVIATKPLYKKPV